MAEPTEKAPVPEQEEKLDYAVEPTSDEDLEDVSGGGWNFCFDGSVE